MCLYGGSVVLCALLVVGVLLTRDLLRHWIPHLLGTAPQRSDKQTWYGHGRFAAPISDPVPLVVPLAPNPTRSTLIEALNGQGRTWKIRFESVGMVGIEAALQCGLGLCGGPRCMPMHGVAAIGVESGLPELPDVDFVMVGPTRLASGVVRAVAEMLQRLAKTSFRA